MGRCVGSVPTFLCHVRRFCALLHDYLRGIEAVQSQAKRNHYCCAAPFDTYDVTLYVFTERGRPRAGEGEVERARRYHRDMQPPSSLLADRRQGT